MPKKCIELFVQLQESAAQNIELVIHPFGLACIEDIWAGFYRDCLVNIVVFDSYIDAFTWRYMPTTYGFSNRFKKSITKNSLVR